MSGPMSNSEPEPGGPLERDAPALPPEMAVEPRTGVGAGADTPEPVRGNSAIDPQDLAVVIDQAVAPVCNSWRPSFAVRAAAAVEAAGFRRVVDDDDTIERLAAALAEADGHRWAGPGGELQPRADYQIDWAIASREHYLTRSRVVVRALRNEERS